MPHRLHRAFTLAEVLLTIALIALLAGLVIGGMNLDSDAFASRPPDRVLVSALKRARLEAIETGRETLLSYDPRGFFLISDAETAKTLARIFLQKKVENAVEKAEQSGIDVNWEEYPNDVGVKFEYIVPELMRNGSVRFGDTQIAHLRFSSDSTMTPARISVHIGDSDFVSFEIDPFNAAPKGVENAR